MRQWTIALFILFSSSQVVNATTGNFFNVTLSGATLTISTIYNPNAPNKVYEHAGVKIGDSGYTLSQCTPQSNGFCSFPISSNAPVSLMLSGPSGPEVVTVCLNVTGNHPLSCEQYQIVVPFIIFITQGGYNGNLGGVAGADQICNSQAYVAGSLIPPGRTFKALMLSQTRYPCSNPYGGASGLCGGSFASDWPLFPGNVYYQPNGIDVFNTVNQNAVFNGEVTTLEDVAGNASVAQFWSGTQSVHSTPDGFHIDAWAFADMNPNADQGAYSTNLAYCDSWTSSSSSVNGSVGTSGRQQGSLLGPLAPSTWGNYYKFNDDSYGYLFNLFIGTYYTCDGMASLVCVG